MLSSICAPSFPIFSQVLVFCNCKVQVGARRAPTPLLNSKKRKASTGLLHEDFHCSSCVDSHIELTLLLRPYHPHSFLLSGTPPEKYLIRRSNSSTNHCAQATFFNHITENHDVDLDCSPQQSQDTEYSKSVTLSFLGPVPVLRAAHGLRLVAPPRSE